MRVGVRISGRRLWFGCGRRCRRASYRGAALGVGACEREQWRNPKGRYCEASARKALPRLAAALNLPLPAAGRGPGRVLGYLGRYTHRVAISNDRLLDIADGALRFRWKDYRQPHGRKTMRLPAEEFIRRFLMYVLPRDFHRIRHFGLLANCHYKKKLALCRRLLGMPPPDYRDRFERLTGESLEQCPACRRGLMVCVETFEPGAEPPRPEDTS